MSDDTGSQRPVVVVVDDVKANYDSLVTAVQQYEQGRLAREFEFVYADSYPELKRWYQTHPGRFVSLVVQDIDFSLARERRSLVDYPEILRRTGRKGDPLAVQGFLIYAYLRQENVDRTSPVLFVSCRIGADEITEFSSLLINPGYGNCAFVSEDVSGPDYYRQVCSSIDTQALRPLDENGQRHWREHHHMVVGRTRRMAHLVYEIQRIGPTSATVLLLGSTGVGKELVANALHRLSPRFDGELNDYPLTVNMAALDRNLIEDELFGHDRGAFTGAQDERAGILEAADGSSVLLDEIGELDHDTQTKLLRAIEYRRVKRIGSSREKEVDIRIIATTNRTVQELQTRFRPDFYARLVQHCIPVPSLRERWQGEPSVVVEDDVDAVFDFVIEQMNRDPRHKRRLTLERATARFIRQLVQQYVDGGNTIFDGNVRSLRNIIERAYERAQYDGSHHISLGHVMPTLGIIRIMNLKAEARPGSATSLEQIVGSLDLRAVERRAIVEALAKTNQHQTQAAELLGIHRDTLRRKMADFGIE
jgi:transcriptional regulator with PAS, ATPase and Fis domain